MHGVRAACAAAQLRRSALLRLWDPAAAALCSGEDRWMGLHTVQLVHTLHTSAATVRTQRAQEGALDCLHTAVDGGTRCTVHRLTMHLIAAALHDGVRGSVCDDPAARHGDTERTFPDFPRPEERVAEEIGRCESNVVTSTQGDERGMRKVHTETVPHQEQRTEHHLELNKHQRPRERPKPSDCSQFKAARRRMCEASAQKKRR